MTPKPCLTLKPSDMNPPKNKAKTVILISAILLLAASFYLAHLSGRAENTGAGDTEESLHLSALSMLAGMLAMPLGIGLIVAEQTGGIPLRIIKILATTALWFVCQIVALMTIQSLSAP